MAEQADVGVDFGAFLGQHHGPTGGSVCRQWIDLTDCVDDFVLEACVTVPMKCKLETIYDGCNTGFTDDT